MRNSLRWLWQEGSMTGHAIHIKLDGTHVLRHL